MSGKYDDIIDLPHHTSPRHPRMQVRDRAAQFAPFSALTGYGDAIDETVRVTDGKVELSEDAKALLDLKQRLLMERIDSRPEITVTYFEPDKRKAGGTYQTITAKLKRINETERVLVFTDGMHISTDAIVAISD